MNAGYVACPAPAKINLFLHVIGRREDGYHLLQSVFRLLDWGDTIHVRVRADGVLAREGEVPGVAPDDDLALRAARLLQQHARCVQGADIRVEKRLPMGGGLGGGSSDAATVLIALNRLWGLELERAELMRLGLQLGADIPFFIFGRDAFVEGIGERMTAIDLAPTRYVVVAPQVQVATAAIFSDPQLTRNTRPIRMADFAASTTCNDLEQVARRRYPEVERVLRWLGQFAPARMTGSGACVFAQMPDEGAALRVVAACPEPWQAWSVASLPAHPLKAWARD